jgi:hypothetical protein
VHEGQAIERCARCGCFLCAGCGVLGAPPPARAASSWRPRRPARAPPCAPGSCRSSAWPCSACSWRPSRGLESLIESIG